LYDGKFRLNAASDDTYCPTGSVSSPPAVAVGSGFRTGQEDDGVMTAPLPMSRAHVRFVETCGQRGSLGAIRGATPSPANENAMTVYVARSESPVDSPMSLGNGRNTNLTGLGDSQHAIPESSLPSQSLPDSPPIVSLPPTASSVNMHMMDALDDIAAGRSSPISDGSSVDDDIPVPLLRGKRDVDYENLEQVAGDIQALADGYEAVRGLLGRLL